MYYLKIVIVASFVASSALAQTDKVCDFTSTSSIYEQIITDNPVNKLIDQRLEEVKARVDIAKQRPNPEISLDYLRTDEFGVSGNVYSLSAKHFIELGNKRSKRIEKEKISIDLSLKDLELKRLENHLNILTNFQKLAQNTVVTSSVQEAVETFRSITKRLSSRASLNPEERISLSTLQLATNDYLARLNDLKNEKRNLEGELEFSMGCRLKTPRYKELSYRTALGHFDEVPGSGLKEIEQGMPKLTEAELEVEKSLGYSDLGIGPSFEKRDLGRDEFYSAGLSVSFALPLFHTNDGGKKVALRKHLAQKIESENNLKQIDIRLKNQIENYKNSLEYLKSMPTLQDLERKHQEVEKLFARGIVSIALSIEAHRQNVDFLTSRFETENDLFQALQEILLITGNKNIIPSLVKGKDTL